MWHQTTSTRLADPHLPPPALYALHLFVNGLRTSAPVQLATQTPFERVSVGSEHSAKRGWVVSGPCHGVLQARGRRR